MVHFSEPLLGSPQVCSYLDDAYLERVDTRIAAVGEWDGLRWAAIEHCLFHPQGGGQPADRGWLEEMEIVPLRHPGSGLVVAVPADEGVALPRFVVGQEVRARIDLHTRMAHAALHSAGHLVDAACQSLGWETLGNNHFPGQARIDFRTTDDPRLLEAAGREELTAALRHVVESAIADDLPVFSHEEQGRRVVHLDALHAAPCGGTHVRSLGELVDVVVPTLKVKRGRIRVSYTAAHRKPQ